MKIWTLFNHTLIMVNIWHKKISVFCSATKFRKFQTLVKYLSKQYQKLFFFEKLIRKSFYWTSKC